MAKNSDTTPGEAALENAPTTCTASTAARRLARSVATARSSFTEIGPGWAVSDFDYAGPFTEAVLLGNVALRYPGTRLIWDGPSMTIANVPEANEYVQHTYRQGWSL